MFISSYEEHLSGSDKGIKAVKRKIKQIEKMISNTDWGSTPDATKTRSAIRNFETFAYDRYVDLDDGMNKEVHRLAALADSWEDVHREFRDLDRAKQMILIRKKMAKDKHKLEDKEDCVVFTK